MAVAIPERPHAILSPSGWDRWGTCPGSVPLTEGIPNTSSRYAREGTAAHQLLQDCLEGGFDAEDLLGREYEVEGEVYSVDMDMADAVNTAIAWIRQEMGDDGILHVEQQVPIGHLTGETDASGLSDVIVVKDGGTTLVVMDYKHGQGVQVYASEKDGQPNGQMGMYALGALWMLSPIYESIENVRLVVLQPRKDWHDGHDTTVVELLAFGERVTQAAGAVALNQQYALHDQLLELVPSDKGCKFCDAKHFCPALRETTMNALAPLSSAEDFADLTLPKKASSLAVDQDADGEKLAEAMRAAPMLEEIIKAVRAEVERRLFNGEPVPGYKLVQGKKGNRQWRDEREAETQLKKRLKTDEMYTKKVISVTVAEKKFKAKPASWAKITPLITQSEGQPSVAPDSDPRPPLQLGAEPGDFEDLTAAAEPAALEAPVDPFS